MKKLFKQKSIKVCAISIVVSGMALVGYNDYSNATMTPEERLFQQNLEALTSMEGSGPIIEMPCFHAFINENDDVYRHTCSDSHINPSYMFECGALTMKKPSYASTESKCWTYPE